MNRMIPYCGLECEKCTAYIATINNDDTLRKKTGKLWTEMNNAAAHAMIHCMGCRIEKMLIISKSFRIRTTIN